MKIPSIGWIDINEYVKKARLELNIDESVKIEQFVFPFGSLIEFLYQPFIDSVPTPKLILVGNGDRSRSLGCECCTQEYIYMTLTRWHPFISYNSSFLVYFANGMYYGRIIEPSELGWAI